MKISYKRQAQLGDELKEPAMIRMRSCDGSSEKDKTLDIC